MIGKQISNGESNFEYDNMTSYHIMTFTEMIDSQNFISFTSFSIENLHWLSGEVVGGCSAHSGYIYILYIPNDNPFFNGEIPAITFSSPVSATCLTFPSVARLDVQIIWLKL